MSDRPTNETIAELLTEQSFAEREEMAASFRDMAADAQADKRELDLDWFMHAFQEWAGAQLDPTP